MEPESALDHETCSPNTDEAPIESVKDRVIESRSEKVVPKLRESDTDLIIESRLVAVEPEPSVVARDLDSDECSTNPVPDPIEAVSVANRPLEKEEPSPIELVTVLTSELC